MLRGVWWIVRGVGCVVGVLGNVLFLLVSVVSVVVSLFLSAHQRKLFVDGVRRSFECGCVKIRA